MKNLTVGVVVADEQEYKPVQDYLAARPHTLENLHGYPVLVYKMERDGRALTAKFCLCGIGKVNAAAATAHLLASGCDVIFNTGLSGGLGADATARGGLVIGERYVEHDFDLTPLDYPRYVKPGGGSLRANPQLFDLFRRLCPSAAVGTLACGDSFVADAGKARSLADDLGAVACDMESAACACACERANAPFLAIRQISDGADGDAVEAYTESNNRAEDTLLSLLLRGFDAILADADLFDALAKQP